MPQSRSKLRTRSRRKTSRKRLIEADGSADFLSAIQSSSPQNLRKTSPPQDQSKQHESKRLSENEGYKMIATFREQNKQREDYHEQQKAQQHDSDKPLIVNSKPKGEDNTVEVNSTINEYATQDMDTTQSFVSGQNASNSKAYGFVLTNTMHQTQLYPIDGMDYVTYKPEDRQLNMNQNKNIYEPHVPSDGPYLALIQFDEKGYSWNKSNGLKNTDISGPVLLDDEGIVNASTLKNHRILCYVPQRGQDKFNKHKVSSFDFTLDFLLQYVHKYMQWERLYDCDQEFYYYLNSNTGKSVWEQNFEGVNPKTMMEAIMYIREKRNLDVSTPYISDDFVYQSHWLAGGVTLKDAWKSGSWHNFRRILYKEIENDEVDLTSLYEYDAPECSRRFDYRIGGKNPNVTQALRFRSSILTPLREYFVSVSIKPDIPLFVYQVNRFSTDKIDPSSSACWLTSLRKFDAVHLESMKVRHRAQHTYVIASALMQHIGNPHCVQEIAQWDNAEDFMGYYGYGYHPTMKVVIAMCDELAKSESKCLDKSIRENLKEFFTFDRQDHFLDIWNDKFIDLFKKARPNTDKSHPSSAVREFIQHCLYAKLICATHIPEKKICKNGKDSTKRSENVTKIPRNIDNYMLLLDPMESGSNELFLPKVENNCKLQRPLFFTPKWTINDLRDNHLMNLRAKEKTTPKE